MLLSTSKLILIVGYTSIFDEEFQERYEKYGSAIQKFERDTELNRKLYKDGVKRKQFQDNHRRKMEVKLPYNLVEFNQQMAAMDKGNSEYKQKYGKQVEAGEWQEKKLVKYKAYLEGESDEVPTDLEV